MPPPVLPESLPFEVMRRTWQPVARVYDLAPNKPTAVTLLGEKLVLVRMRDRILATQDACPHKGFKLSCGYVQGGDLVCAYHGWRFRSDGGCAGVPSLPNPPESLLGRAALETYAVQERYGLVWVRLDPNEIAPLPDIPAFGEQAGWQIEVPPPMHFACGFRREIENYVDMTHFAFAHRTTLGAAADTVLPKLEITRHADGFEMNAPFPALSSGDSAPSKLQSAHHRQQRCYLPNFTTIKQTFEDGDERMLLHVPSPITETSCNVFWLIAQPDNFRGPELGHQVDFSTKVLEEDRLMCEQQVPAEVPLNPSRGGWGVLVSPGDTLANTFQKSFRDFLIQHQSAPIAV